MSSPGTFSDSSHHSVHWPVSAEALNDQMGTCPSTPYTFLYLSKPFELQVFHIPYTQAASEVCSFEIVYIRNTAAIIKVASQAKNVSHLL